MKDVHIKDNKGQVDHPSVRISRDTGEITWFAYGAEGATIVFSSPAGSPFKESVFTVPATGSVSSGPVKAGALPQTYKYTVVGKGGSTDPVIIIDN